MSQKKTVYYFRVLRAIGCIGIVILHTYYFYIGNFEAAFFQEVASYTIRNLQMWAVPCFVMVSGALLLDPERPMTVGKIYKKYVFRALVALIFFSLVFHLYDRLVNGQKLGITDLWIWFMKFYTDGSWSHLWYLYMLVSIYILLPVFRKITAGSDQKEIRYFLIVCLIFQVVLATVNTLFNIRTGFYIGIYTVYPFYFFLGYALSKDHIPISKMWSLILTVGSAVLIIGLTYLQIRFDIASLKSLLGNYSFLVVVLLSVGVFSLARHLSLRKENAWIRWVDEQSFGIYLIHMIFVKIGVFLIKWNPYPQGGMAAVFGIAAGIFVLSMGITWCLKRIPGVHHIL